jgi:hypothetical protein
LDLAKCLERQSAQANVPSGAGVERRRQSDRRTGSECAARLERGGSRFFRESVEAAERLSRGWAVEEAKGTLVQLVEAAARCWRAESGRFFRESVRRSARQAPSKFGIPDLSEAAAEWL